jgi:Tfp pilus assembly protein PilE
MKIKPFKILAKKPVEGFTIVELMIAATVFAVVLIIAQTSFVQIGHLFYRGVSITNTQEVADHIYQDVSGNFQNAAGFTSAKNSSAGGYDYYCIGNTRYTYRLDNEVNTDLAATHTSATGNYGILKDVLQGTGSGCPAPCDDAAPSCVSGVALKNPAELLGDKMRVEQFDITQSTSTSNLYNIQIVIAYGETSTLTYKTPGDLKTVSCQGDSNNNFCAVSSVNTAIYKAARK